MVDRESGVQVSGIAACLPLGLIHLKRRRNRQDGTESDSPYQPAQVNSSSARLLAVVAGKSCSIAPVLYISVLSLDKSHNTCSCFCTPVHKTWHGSSIQVSELWNDWQPCNGNGYFNMNDKCASNWFWQYFIYKHFDCKCKRQNKIVICS